MKLAKWMTTRVYLMGVLLSLAHLHLVRTLKCALRTQGQVSDTASAGPMYLRISQPTFRHAKQEHDTSNTERDNDITTVPETFTHFALTNHTINHTGYA